MITLIRRLFWILALHAAFYICYPDTGQWGLLYSWVSLMFWTIVVISFNFGIEALKSISGLISVILDAIFIAAMVLSIAVTMPQQDKKSVWKKIQNKQYPDIKQIHRGIGNFGFQLPVKPNLPSEIEAELKNKLPEAVKK